MSKIIDNNPEKTTSFFEFWPMQIMYAPVAIQWILLAIRHRSITVPLLANPKLRLSGMVGVGKSELMSQAQDICQEAILTWNLHIVSTLPFKQQAQNWLEKIKALDIDFPFVCKPDIGCRGSGVKLIRTFEQFQGVIAAYPIGAALIAQKLASYEHEAGVFYVKMPNQDKGKIVSLTFKHSPSVTGDGTKTLKQLVTQDSRARDLLHLYQDKHLEIWNEIIPKNHKLTLLFSASHCQGAVFTDARSEITPELSESINNIMQGLPEFHYGRLDVKFSSIDQLKKGKTIEIIEINGASSESIHIWDKNTSLIEAIKALLWQYRTLFTLGAYQRTKGYKPPGIKKFFKHWRIEKNLAKHYPDTD